MSHPKRCVCAPSMRTCALDSPCCIQLIRPTARMYPVIGFHLQGQILIRFSRDVSTGTYHTTRTLYSSQGRMSRARKAITHPMKRSVWVTLHKRERRVRIVNTPPSFYCSPPYLIRLRTTGCFESQQDSTHASTLNWLAFVHGARTRLRD